MASQVAGYIGKFDPGNGTQYSLGSTAYGVCDTAAGTAAKTVEMTGFTLMTGATVFIKFTNTNSAANPTLNVNGTGAKPIVQYGTTAVSTAADTTGWRAGAVVALTYDGTSWVRDQGFNTNSTYYYESCYVSTAAGTAAKVGTLSNYKLQPGHLQVLLFNGNTANSALTLNINGQGAKPIYINGSPSAADTNYGLPAAMYFVYYDGTNYYFRTDSKITGDITGSAEKLGTLTVGDFLNPIYLVDGVATESKGNTIPFVEGTGTTAGTWLGNLNNLTDYYDGLLILYKSPVAGASTTTLNLNGLGAKTVYINNTTKLTTHYPANQPILLVYSSSQNSGCWMALDNYWVNSDTYTSALCTTAAGTAAKAASCTYWTATAKSYIHINFRYANSSASALTLNINSTGAKPIYINGTASSASNSALPAGSYLAYYDGTNYYLRTDGLLPGDGISGNAATATRATTADKFTNSQSVTLTGDVTGTASSQAGWSLATTIGTGKVTNAMLAGSIANDKLVNSKVTIAGNDVSLGGSLTADTLRTSLGLSNAMHFIGKATVAITDGSTTDPVISGYTVSTMRKAGDVIIDKDTSREYVWSSEGKWELLGQDASTTYDSGAAATNKWVARIQQNSDRTITATMGTLDTSGTWSGKAAKLTDLTTSDQASSTSTARRVWFAYSDNVTGRPAYSDDFTYVTSTKTLNVANVNGNAATATKLKTARTIQTNLASTSVASFDGSANITPGVTGTLPVGNGGTGVTTVADIFATYGVEYIEGTQTAATGSWTGVTKSDALYVGKTIAYKLPYAGSGNATLMLTLADGTSTAGGPVYAGNTRLTTHYPAGSIMVMVWNGTDWRTNPYYNTNTNTLLRVYSSATDLNVPLIGQSSANSTTAAWSTYTGTYKDWYGAIPNDDTKRAKINLATGVLTVPGGVVGNLTGNASTATKATNDSDGNAINTTYLKRSGGQMIGNITWKDSTALPEATSLSYFLGITAFADGGNTKWISANNAIKSLVGSSAIGNTAKPIYWTGSAFNALTETVGSNVKPVYLNAGTITSWDHEAAGAWDLSGAQDLNTKYDAGFYAIEGGNVSNYPANGAKYAAMIVVPYRKPSGNTTPDWGWQLATFAQDKDALWFRVGKASDWRGWRNIAHIAANTAVGDGSQLIYVDANGIVTKSAKDIGASNHPVWVDNGTIKSATVGDSFVTYGGQNFAGSYGVIDGIFNHKLRANRFAGFKAAGTTIQYSTDGGSTWTDYGASDTQKISLFTTSTNLRLVPSGNVSANSQLRIIMDTGAGHVYTNLKKIMMYLSTNYSSGCTVTIDAALQNDPTNFTKVICTDQAVAGWSGWNVIQCDFTTYGNSPASQYGRIRFTFKHTGVSSGHEAQGLIVCSIYGYGGMGWTTPSTLAATDHVYSFDHAFNVTFPANVTATKFIGPLQGNATTATTWQTARTLTIGATGKSVNGSANVSWSMDEIMGASDASKFYRGDKTWSNEISGGILKVTYNNNTFSIGSQNASYNHLYNSANIPFIFNNSILTTTGNLGSETYPWNNLYIGKGGTKNIYYVGTKANYSMIRFIDNTGDTYGNGISIGGGGQVVIGSGESATAMDGISTNGGTETTYILSDGVINLEANANSIANRIGAQITTAGNIIPVKAEVANNNAQSLGVSGNRWSKLFVGTADSYGSTGQPIYWNAGVPATIDWHIGNKDVGEHNADNITYNMIGYYTSNGPATTLGATTNDGAIYAQAYNSTWVGQIAQDYRDGGLFVRGKNNGTWQAWKQIPMTTTASVGSATQPVYINAGTITECTAYTGLLTDLSWTAGTTAGPTLSITVGGTTKTAVIPSAAAGASGVVTTGAQQFDGNKTFKGNILAQANNTYNIGANTTRFKQLYAISGYFGGPSSAAGGVYLYTNSTTYGRLYVSTEGTANTPATTEGGTDGVAGTTGIVILALGNSIAVNTATEYGSTVSGADNARGVIRIYGTNANHTDIFAQANGNRSFYLPNYAGNMYAVHAASNSAVGEATTPVYVQANGRVAACTAYSSATVNIANKLKTTQATNSTNMYILGQSAAGAGQDTYIATAYASGSANTTGIYFKGSTGVLMGAAWNDYAEFRKPAEENIEAGRVVREVGDGSLTITTKRLERGCEIVSDTYGFGIGENEATGSILPTAATGRVLAYPYEDIEEYVTHIGWPVCSGPNGTVSIMTEEEEEKYPSRIIGTISEVPNYEVWHGGTDVEVKGRVWIRIR